MNHIKQNRWITNMGEKNLIVLTLLIFSKEMIITKKSIYENQHKFTYKKQLISDLDYVHEEWLKSINSKF